MPTYRYRCGTCGDEFEVWQSITDPALTTHEGCGGELVKVFSAAGIVLKGSGFYKTDSRSGNGSRQKTPSEKSDAGKSGSDTSDAGTSGSDTSGSDTSGSGKSDTQDKSSKSDSGSSKSGSSGSTSPTSTGGSRT